MSPQPLAVAAAVCASTFAAAWVLSKLFARMGLVAVPNSRSLHTRPTAVAVGLVVPLAVALTMVLVERQIPIAVVAAVLLGGMGFADDIMNFRPRPRLVVQFLIAAVGVISLYGLASWVTPFAVVGVVAAVNGLNFMDGINGITASLGVVLGLTLFLAARHLDSDPWQVVGLTVAAACLGYLPNNFPTARSFPGDVLPYTLGALFLLGTLDLATKSVLVLFSVGPLVPSFVDTLMTAVKRFRGGQGLMTPHRDHAYQRLARRTSHTTATMTFLGLAIVSGITLPVALIWGPTMGAAWLACACLACFAVLAQVPADTR